VDAAENLQNLLVRSSVAHGRLLEQFVLAYSSRVIISDMYGFARDSKQLSSLHEMSRDVFGYLAMLTYWRALQVVSAG
jgi:hypothetical protein